MKEITKEQTKDMTERIGTMSEEQRIDVISQMLKAESYRFYFDAEADVVFLKIMENYNTPPSLFRMNHADFEKIQSVIRTGDK